MWDCRSDLDGTVSHDVIRGDILPYKIHSTYNPTCHSSLSLRYNLYKSSRRFGSNSLKNLETGKRFAGTVTPHVIGTKTRQPLAMPDNYGRSHIPHSLFDSLTLDEFIIITSEAFHIMKIYSHNRILANFGLLACIAPAAKSEFIPLNQSPQTFTKIELGMVCPPGSGNELVNQIAWTIVPVAEDSAITISTQPENLVDVSEEDGALKFRYNSVSLTRHETEGTGVKIEVPADQINEILTIGSTYAVKMFPGFTNLKQVNANADGVVLQLEWDDTVAPVNFSGRGNAQRTTIWGNVGTFNLSGNAHAIQIDGNVQGGAISTNAAAITIDGTVQEQLTVGGFANAITTADCTRVSLQNPFSNICYELLGVTLEPGPWNEATTNARICGS